MCASRSTSTSRSAAGSVISIPTTRSNTVETWSSRWAGTWTRCFRPSSIAAVPSHPIRSAPATTPGTRPDHGPCGSTRSEQCDRRNRSCRPANPDKGCSARLSWRPRLQAPTSSFKLPRRGHFFAAQSAKKRRPLLHAPDRLTRKALGKKGSFHDRTRDFAHNL